MPNALKHDLRIDFSRDTSARQDFVVGLRRYILNELAAALKARFKEFIEPAFLARSGRPFFNQDEIHTEMLRDPLFRIYSTTRYNAQEMSWNSVLRDVDAALPSLADRIATMDGDAPGTLELDPGVALPENVAGREIHLMPGGYDSADPLRAGAIYDNGLTVFTAGLLGPDIDDIGQSLAHYVRHRFPELRPSRILDCGCTIGHNSVPWAQCFPDAQVHAIDVAAASLRYGRARAQSLGVPIHFHQMNATCLSFEDASFDVIFSSQFLHELPLEGTSRYLAEAYRVLKPGGLLVTMELPPNKRMNLYEQFYLDWDCYYNHEPYYRAFRDSNVIALAREAGFSPASYFDFTVPQYFKTSELEFVAQVEEPAIFNGETGRLSDDIRYFGFGFVR